MFKWLAAKLASFGSAGRKPRAISAATPAAVPTNLKTRLLVLTTPGIGDTSAGDRIPSAAPPLAAFEPKRAMGVRPDVDPVVIDFAGRVVRAPPVTSPIASSIDVSPNVDYSPPFYDDV